MTEERRLDATRAELLAEVLRRCMGIDANDNARHDFGDWNGGPLQRPSEVAAELLRALSDEGLTIAALPQPATEPALLARWPEADLFAALDAEGWFRGMSTADATKATRQLLARLAAQPSAEVERPKRTRIDWSNVVVDEGDEAP